MPREGKLSHLEVRCGDISTMCVFASLVFQRPEDANDDVADLV